MLNKNRFSLVQKLHQREMALIDHRSMPKIWTDEVVDHWLEHTDKFYYKDLYGHHGCVNSVEFSEDGQFMISGGDDKRVFLWKLWDAIFDKSYRPKVMSKEHSSNIFCLSFDSEQKRIYSGGNDELVIVHDIETGEAFDVECNNDVYGISVDPTNDKIFASASNTVTIWDLRSSISSQLLAQNGYGVFHGVMYNPSQSHLIATASSKDGIELYDIRQPFHRLCKYYSSYLLNNSSVMCVRFNRAGNRILTLGRKLPPILYDIKSPYPQVLFDGCEFFNSCTLKNCSFAGERDQFVISGSDNFLVYIWKIPDEINDVSSLKNPLKSDSVHYVSEPLHMLTSHRSIVNQVCFNKHNGVIASTGVEKIIKLWSPIIQFDEDSSKFSKTKQSKNFVRSFYSYNNFIGSLRSHSENSSVEEDIQLIAYFDSMLDRDLSFSSFSSSEDNFTSYYDSFRKIPTKSPFSEKLLSKSNNKINDISSAELDSNSGEKFSIQKRYRFNKKTNEKFTSENYLDLVYAKRMHVRYLISTVENIKKQLDAIKPNLKKLIEKSLENQKKKKIQSSNNNASKKTVPKTLNIFLLLRKQKRELRNLDDLNKNIKLKKKYKVLQKAYQIVVELYTALREEALFRRNVQSLIDKSIETIVKDLEKSEVVEFLARQMSTIKDQQLYDKKLFGLICNLYKKVLHLTQYLNEIHAQDFQSPLFSDTDIFLFFKKTIIDTDNDTSSVSGVSSLDESSEENFDDIFINEELEQNSNQIDKPSISLDEIIFTSDSSSDSFNGEYEKKSEKISLSVDDNKNSENIVDDDLPIQANSSASSSKIHFKKINFRKRNYKQKNKKTVPSKKSKKS